MIIKQVFYKVLFFTIYCGSLMLLFFILFHNKILTLWVGDVIATRISSLVILMAIASFIGVITGAPYHLFNALSLPKINFYIMTLYFIVLSITIGILLYIFPHELNIFGYSLIFSNLFMLFLYAVMIKRTFNSHAI